VPIAYDAIAALVSKYEGLTAAQRHSYKEANTRKDFIEPLFEALGWDVRNIERNEVEEEKHVRPGFADYAFKLDGIIRFYLEAKPLRENAYNEEYARQVITYAYNKGVTWAVLCNFCTLQVFNAEWETTDLNSARVLNLSCGEYATPDSPLELLSRDAFLSGELEKKAQTYGTMRPRLPVEKSLFAQLRRWRQTLFSQIANYRRDLTHDQVDEAVLRLLNRLIFIRNCEDRRIEEARLRAALREWEQHGHHPQLVEMLRQVFHDFDANYDSDLFNLALADQVFVEGMALEEIIRGLYQPPGSLAAYDFSVIDADVLGQVYEQYLGYVAREVKDKAEKQRALAGLGYGAVQVELEAKRQRRKERGIYYTPRWVVDYIARQTVGRYLEEHGYDDVMNVKILDPASGSGSFLIRAFDMLLDYHASIKGKSASELDRYERWRILTGNIYGVDVDPQAVEIARLNLLLRAVARRDLLPSLADNIRLGNSLISGDEAELRRCFGKGWKAKQPFDWQREFPDIMARGGFDIVIGNPPYIRLHNIPDAERDWFFERFHTARNKCDVYGFFIERCASLLQEGGRLGFILPNTWCALDSFEPLRSFIMRTFVIEEVSGLENPFHESTVSPVILVLRKTSAAGARGRNLIVHNEFGVAPGPTIPQPLRATTHIPQATLASAPGRVVNLCWSPEYNRLTQRIASLSLPLGEVCVLNFGIKTGDDSKFVIRGKSSEHDKPVLRGRNIHRYGFVWESEYVRYLPDEMKKKPIARPGDRERFEAPEKIILQGRSGRELTAAYDTDGYYTLGTTHLIRPGRPEFPLKYILGLINSKLMTFWYGSQFITSTQSENELARLPIRDLTSLTGNDTDVPAQIIALVQRMLDLHQRLAAKGGVRDEERAQIEREIARTDREIDDLVYDLYGLTAAERDLIEREMTR